MENFNANQHITFTSSKPIYDFYVAGPYQPPNRWRAWSALSACCSTAI